MRETLHEFEFRGETEDLSAFLSGCVRVRSRSTPPSFVWADNFLSPPSARQISRILCLYPSYHNCALISDEVHPNELIALI